MPCLLPGKAPPRKSPASPLNFQIAVFHFTSRKNTGIAGNLYRPGFHRHRQISAGIALHGNAAAVQFLADKIQFIKTAGNDDIFAYPLR